MGDVSLYELVEHLASTGPVNLHLQRIAVSDDPAAQRALNAVVKSSTTDGSVLDQIARKWSSDKRWGATHPTYLALNNSSCLDSTREDFLHRKDALTAILCQGQELPERWIGRLLDIADKEENRGLDILTGLVKRGDLEEDHPLGRRIVEGLLPHLDAGNLDSETTLYLVDLVGGTSSLHHELLATSTNNDILTYLATFVEMTPEEWKRVVDVTILQHITTSVPDEAHNALYQLDRKLPTHEKERIVTVLKRCDLEGCSRKDWIRNTYLHTQEEKDTQEERAQDASSDVDLQGILDEPRITHKTAWAIYRHPLATAETRVAAISRGAHHDVDKAMNERPDDLEVLEAFCLRNPYLIHRAPKDQQRRLAFSAARRDRRLDDNVLNILEEDDVKSLPVNRAVGHATLNRNVRNHLHALMSNLTANELEVLGAAWSDDVSIEDLIGAAKSCAQQ